MKLEKKFILEERFLKRLKKNTNVPKFLVRLYMKYFRKHSQNNPNEQV